MSSQKRVRIQDVADKSGVSMMTVSRVLNKEGKVSEKTREKVLAAAEALNYRPNVSARRLASAKSFFIGLVYDNPSANYVSKFLLGALKQCRANGYHLVVDEVRPEVTLTSIKDLIEVTQVDGMILLPPISDNKQVLAMLESSRVPYIRISPDTDLTLSPYLCMDDYQAAFELTERLIQQGHKRIAHIMGDPKQGVSRLRYQGYLDAMRSNQIEIPPEYIEQGHFTYKSGLVAAQKLLANAEQPTAIFAGNDDMAAATISAAHMATLNVPEQLCVVGFDDTELATTVWPHLTTVRQPITEMAEKAIELLVSGQVNLNSHSKGGSKNSSSKHSNSHSSQSVEQPLIDSHYRHVLPFEIVERESSLIPINE